ncbi:MAG: hypothetical protein BWY76_00455 [bacterium ADurb.Bin429]|nr:MAG: hypothetical protein BWY76_00455 [bacterium ADurb.Bin429]
MNTTMARKINAITAMLTVAIATLDCARATVKICRIVVGRLIMMPAKMMSEMPLPMPLSVSCSPIHIRNDVPAVITSTSGTTPRIPSGAVTAPIV